MFTCGRDVVHLGIFFIYLISGRENRTYGCEGKYDFVWMKEEECGDVKERMILYGWRRKSMKK